MKLTDYYIEIGPYIKELREKNNMTKKQLADGICSPSYITLIENGSRCPTSVILRQIATKLGITPEYLFRAIESPASLHVKELLDQIFLYIERHDFKSVYNLINEKEKELSITSIHDTQIIRTFKSLSVTMLSQDYQRGIDAMKNILELTYNKESNPTDIEFIIMFNYGFFLLLNNQKKEAYNHLISIKKYMDNIKFLHTRVIFPAFYMFLISACLDMSKLDESSKYINYAIDYCKKNNTYNFLRELYFLKSELYYRLKKEKDFKVWYSKALTLHDLIKNSDDEYLDTFIKSRLEKLKQIPLTSDLSK
ncbi:helix-turn-helix domain-containing protein [Tepidibacter aestuarii]|uniref:helix-turn-helix domain-containing protein n=1 Tax=Tepidibacter aestuarii TaxID=2925782 RepID=UPI0020BD6A91|nr:helix-turn-helix transcriptional regulator [Tepidibacter aestuarii]CAH2213410.1 HTH cro/C1-type domain-containing protein [Tepidibacter aestuarii]